MDCTVRGVTKSQTRLSELHSLTKHSKTPEAKHMEIGHSESKGFPRGRIASQTPMEWRAPKVMNPKPNPITFTEGVQRVGTYSLGQNTGAGSLSFLQGIFPTQGLNPGFPRGRWILYQLSH